MPRRLNTQSKMPPRCGNREGFGFGITERQYDGADGMSVAIPASAVEPLPLPVSRWTCISPAWRRVIPALARRQATPIRPLELFDRGKIITCVLCCPLCGDTHQSSVLCYGSPPLVFSVSAFPVAHTVRRQLAALWGDFKHTGDSTVKRRLAADMKLGKRILVSFEQLAELNQLPPP